MRRVRHGFLALCLVVERRTLLAVPLSHISSDYRLQEDLILRNVHPFGVVFHDPNARTEPENDSNRAFCATGAMGALELWEKVKQDGYVFYYCKARDVSQWTPPCMHLRVDPAMPYDEDDPRRYPYPMSIEPLNIALPSDDLPVTYVPEKPPLERVSGLEEQYFPAYFDFAGRLDHLKGVAAIRSQSRSIPRDLQDAALREFADKSSLDATYNGALESVVRVEEELNMALRDAFEDAVPDPTIYATTHFSYDRRNVIATAWQQLGQLAIARGNASLGLNCFRRAIHWLPDHVAAYMNLASVLTSFKYYDDSCECVQVLKSSTELVGLALVRVQFKFPHCTKVFMHQAAPPSHVMVALQFGGALSAVLLLFLFLQACLFGRPPRDMAGMPEKKRKSSHKRKHQ
ncbi:hypothetical protein LEN26_011525 [Aphanomyces euteiches]|nr:hypothetical protein LEN26_011525 [Aphanomyces euteiches]